MMEQHEVSIFLMDTLMSMEKHMLKEIMMKKCRTIKTFLGENYIFLVSI